MKNTSGGSIVKLLAAIIIGVVFIFLVGTAVNGWQRDDINDDNNSDETEGALGNVDESNGDTDGKNEGTVDNNTQNSTENGEIPTPPQITSYLTGLEISEELSTKLPFVFITEPNAPLYGISDSELTLEIPTETGKTRFMIYRNDISELGKIGAISKARDYISQITKFYGGILVANGNDDIIDYASIPATLHIDLSKNVDYTYKENGKHLYTDNLSLLEIVKKEGIDLSRYTTQNMPFEFCDFFETVTGQNEALSVTIPYTDNQTTLTYDKSCEKYILSKVSRNKIDMLDGKAAAYKNVFILFADTVTYETSAGTESVVNSASGGSGYYVSGGKLSEIRWSVDASGHLLFKDLKGNKLIVNRGNSYVGYYKSSDADSVIFE